MALVMAASAVSSFAPPASADPVLPPGATAKPPAQKVWSAKLDGEASTAKTQGRRGPGVKKPAKPAMPDLSVYSADQKLTPVAAKPDDVRGFQPGRSVEDVSARTPSSTEFVNPDGTRTIRAFDGVVFVPDGAGGLRWADTTLVRPAGSPRLTPVAAANVSFASVGDDAELARLDLGAGRSVAFGVDGARVVGAQADGGVARFAGMRAGADLELSATASGMKETLVLRSPSAPKSWLFPLRLRGVRAVKDAASGSVLLVDATERVAAVIPPGFMEDSSFDPRSGAPARSNKVTYTLVGDGARTALRVDLDAGWLSDPARVWPVRVDPTVDTYAAGSDDTFVSSHDYANRNNSSETELLTGTYNSGAEKSVSFIHFNSAMSALTNKYIVSAQLNLYNHWSYSCVAKPVTVHRVTAAWSGPSTKTWAGPAYESTPLDTRSFAYGYSACPAGGWGTFNIPRQRMTDWVHGVQSFQGFTVRASMTNSTGWKRFWSQNYGTSSKRPYMQITYANDGAAYSLPTASFDPPVTPVQTGKLTVRVKNWGTSTWTPTNNYRLGFTILNASGSVVQTGTPAPMTKNVGPHQTDDVTISIAPLAFGNYTLRLDMVNPSGQSFQAVNGVPYGQFGFSVVDGPPTVTAVSPTPGGYADTLTPTLWGQYFDPDGAGTARLFKFKACNGGTPAAPTGTCQGGDSMAWQPLQTWVVPSGVFEWGKKSWWQIKLSDGTHESAWIGPFDVTPVVDQPAVTSHLAGAPEGAEMPGVNPQVGNYSTSATDAVVKVVGPLLSVQRTYNSQDLRTSGGFGAGWSTPWDQRVVPDPDGTGNVVVTLPTGLEVRFGKKPDGTYAPPQGQNLTLVYTESPAQWTLRDVSGYRRVFDGPTGRLLSVTDEHGRVQIYTYDGAGQLATVTDAASGRALHLTWANGHIESVSTDPPAPGQAPLTWNYDYSGDTLTSVCAPLGAASCTTYTYTTSSHYRSVVADDNPVAYWPLGEEDGASGAANVVARSPDQHEASFVKPVDLGVPGALAGSPDTAAELKTGFDGPIRLPDALVSATGTLAAEMWFKASPGNYGYLFGEQNGLFLQPMTVWSPMLYVGTDGKLRGLVPVASAPTPITSGFAGKCADLAGGAILNETKIQVYTCNGTTAQAWSWYADGTLRVKEKCMDINGGGVTPGTLVQLHTCHGGSNQVWARDGNRLKNPVSGLCLHAPNSTNGSQLVIQTCDGSTNQIWTTVPTRTDPITTAGTVNDGNWHHVVLTSSVDHQELYLDGALVGEVTGVPVDHRGADKTYLGHGSATVGWPGGPPPATSFRFTGQIDEVAVYRHALGAEQVAAHWAARIASHRLATVAEPEPTPGAGAYTVATVGYDAASGRVTTLTDRNGAAWSLSPVTLGEEERQLTIWSNIGDSITYKYDAKNNGRLTAREVGADTKTWAYNEDGFVASTTDENGNVTSYETDERGNVTKATTCRVAPSDCQSRYFGYYYNAEDPLDPRNDVEVWSADARSADANDPTYRTIRELDEAGRITKITYPKPAGQSTNPIETFTYSEATPATITMDQEARPFLAADQTVLPISDENYGAEIGLPFPVWVGDHPYVTAEVLADGWIDFDESDNQAYLDVAYGLPNCIGSTGSVRTATMGTAPARKFVIEWRNVGLCSDPTSRLSFEAVFSEDGTIHYNYADLDGSSEQVAVPDVGIWDGEERYYLTGTKPSPQNDTAVRFIPTAGPPPGYTVSEQSATFEPADGTVLALTGDDEVVETTLPFPVTYYGQSYSTAWVATNGWLSFTGPDGAGLWWYGGGHIPSPEPPDGVVFPLHADLVVDASSSVRTSTLGTAPNRRYIVEWRNVRPVGDSSSRFSVEATFYENGEIWFNYSGFDSGDLADTCSTIGVENAAGDAAVMHASCVPLVSNGTAVVFTRHPGSVGGLLIESTGKNGAVTEYTYNSAGDLVAATDPVGLVTTNTFDALGRVISTNVSGSVGGTPVDYGTTTFTYNAVSQVATKTEPAITNPVSDVTHTRRTTHAYNAAGRHISQTVEDTTGGDPARTTTWVYDGAGRLISTTEPDGAVTTQEWNAAGDLVRKTFPGGLVLEYRYDDGHRLLDVKATGAGVDPMNASATELMLESRQYDPAGRIATTVDAMGRVTNYTYYGDNLPHTTVRDRPDPTPDLTVETRVYDAAGNPTTVTTAGGITTTYTYDPAGNVVTEAFDPSGLTRVTTHTYNSDSTVMRTEMTGAASPGRTERVEYTYDAAGRELTTKVDNAGGTPAQLTVTKVRDPRGLVIEEEDASEVTTQYSYDATGAVVTVTGAPRDVWVNGILTEDVAPVTTFGRNTFGEVTHERDPNLVVTTTAYDAMGRPASTTLPSYTPPGSGSPITPTASTTYNALGLRETTTDPLGRVTSFAYDKYGRLVTRTLPDPDGAGPKAAPVWSHSYSRAGELLDTTDPVGAQTKATYDDLGRQITSTLSERISGTPVYFITNLAYDDAGRLISTTSPLDHVTTMEYNAAGGRTKVTDPTGRFTKTGYDLVGRVVSTVGGQGSTYASPVKLTVYDLAGRPTDEKDCTPNASGGCATVLRTRTLTYDGAGRPTTVMSPQGRPTYYGYDDAGMLTSVTQRVEPTSSASAITVELGYDRLGRRTRMVDGEEHATIYTFTPWGLPESTIEPSTTVHPDLADRTWTTVYNAAGEAVEDRLPGGVTRTRTYDNLGRLTGESGSGAEAPTTARSLNYDPLGRIVSASSPAGNHTYTWSDRGLLAASTGYGGGATFTYDAEAKLTSRVDPSGTTTFGYDDAGRTTSISDPLTGQTSTRSYDAAGRLVSTTYGSGNPSRSFTYDSLGRIETDTWRKPDATIEASVDYEYDLDDLLVQKTTTGPTGAGANIYEFDGLGRLTRWVSPAGVTTDYEWDKASNRIKVITPAGSRTSTFDERNRIISTSGAGEPDDNYAWSPRGSLISATRDGQTTVYQFDAFERLASVAKSGGYSATFTYDSLDRPAQRNASSFGYADLSNEPVLSPTAAGEAKLLRDPTGTALSTKTGAGTATTVLTDILHGDVAATADPDTADLDASASYDPWGVPTGASTLPAGFQGGWTDPDSGLTNAHARWYDPALGAFTSRDTWTLDPDPLAAANRYIYANGSPLSGTDRDGHMRRNEGGSPPVVKDQHGCPETGDCQSSGRPSEKTHKGKKRKQSGCPRCNVTPAGSGATFDYVEQAEKHRRQTVANLTTILPIPVCSFTDVKALNYCGPSPFASLDPKADSVVNFDPVGECIEAMGRTLCLSEGDSRNGEELAEAIDEVLKDNPQFGGSDAGLATAIRIACLAIAADEDDPHPNCSNEFMSWLDQEFCTLGEMDESGWCTWMRDHDYNPIPGTEGGVFAPESFRPFLNGRAFRTTTINDRTYLCSFSGDTGVVMADGSKKPISEIKPGDKVLATDPETGETGSRVVTGAWVHEDTVVRLDIDGGSLVTTLDHPFWNQTDRQWKAAGSLKQGDLLLSVDGSTAAVSAPRMGSERLADAYNITVAGIHTYYVLAGNTPVLVHNCDIPWSNPAVGRAARDLENGATSVTVSSRSQAEELFLRQYQGAGYRNATGLSPTETKDLFGSKVGTYHWDDAVGADGRVLGHGPNNPHGGLPHLQIHTFDGPIVRIFWSG